MHSFPFITIGLPTYNRLNYLQEAYESVKATQFEKLEIIISLDVHPVSGLPDKSILRWLKKVSEFDRRINFFITPQNLGLSNNWNFIAEKATGDYMMLLGDDDRLLPNTILELYKGIEAGADISFSNHYLINENGIRLTQSEQNTRRFNRYLLENGIVHNIEKYIWLNAVPISAALIKTELLKEIRFPPDMNTPEIVFFLKAAQKGAIFHFNSDYLVEYRVHSGSATSQGLFLEKLFECLDDFSVTPANERYKIQFMQHLIGGAFHRYIKTGQPKKALQLFFHRYYPRRANYIFSFVKQLFSLIYYKRKAL